MHESLSIVFMLYHQTYFQWSSFTFKNVHFTKHHLLLSSTQQPTANQFVIMVRGIAQSRFTQALTAAPPRTSPTCASSSRLADTPHLLASPSATCPHTSPKHFTNLRNSPPTPRPNPPRTHSHRPHDLSPHTPRHAPSRFLFTHLAFPLTLPHHSSRHPSCIAFVLAFPLATNRRLAIVEFGMLLPCPPAEKHPYLLSVPPQHNLHRPPLLPHPPPHALGAKDEG